VAHQKSDPGATRGQGGELHQRAEHDDAVLTTQQGTPVSDDQNSLRIGARGPTALEDFHLREKLFHFDHERIPERVVHARGFGVHGYFESYESLSDLTIARLIFICHGCRWCRHSDCGPIGIYPHDAWATDIAARSTVAAMRH
jgi:hypothetical protein